jgi:hypothetical protein
MSYSTSIKKVIRFLLKSFTSNVVSAAKTIASTVRMGMTRRKTTPKKNRDKLIMDAIRNHRDISRKIMKNQKFMSSEESQKKVKIEPKVIKEEDKDSWYKKMGDRPPNNPEDEPVMTWMEYFDLKDEQKSKKG